jgi:hypothetical protein
MKLELTLITALLLTPLAGLRSSFHLFQSCINPIFLRLLPFSPECSAFAFFAFAISLSNITCVTDHFAGSSSVLPA